MEIEFLEQSSSNKNTAKYLSIPTIFISNLAIFIIAGYYLDKKFDIGNYILVFIFLGFYMASYSTYKVVKKLAED